MVTVSWDMEGTILVDIMPKGTITNSEAYVNMLQKLLARLHRVGPHRHRHDVLLQHNNAQPHISSRNMEAIARSGGLCCPILHSPDLAPSDNHHFSQLKKAGQEFFREGTQALVLRWHKEVERDGDCAEKYSYFPG